MFAVSRLVVLLENRLQSRSGQPRGLLVFHGELLARHDEQPGLPYRIGVVGDARLLHEMRERVDFHPGHPYVTSPRETYNRRSDQRIPRAPCVPVLTEVHVLNTVLAPAATSVAPPHSGPILARRSTVSQTNVRGVDYREIRFTSGNFQYLAGCPATPSIDRGAPGEEPARRHPLEGKSMEAHVSGKEASRLKTNRPKSALLRVWPRHRLHGRHLARTSGAWCQMQLDFAPIWLGTYPMIATMRAVQRNEYTNITH